MLMFEELALVSPVFFPLFVLVKDLLWTGLLFLLHRHLHQSGALTMEALQDPPPDPVEGMEEDIADKVGPGWGDQRTTCGQQGPSLTTCARGVDPHWGVFVEVHLGTRPHPGKQIEHLRSGDSTTGLINSLLCQPCRSLAFHRQDRGD